MGHHIWTDGNPLVYTEWYSPKKLRFVGEAVWDIVQRKLLQPLLEVTSPCTAMIPLPHPRWTNWVKVPCDFQPSADIGVGYICKKHIPTITQKPSILDISAWMENRDDRHTLVQPNRYCTGGSTHFENSCFKVHTGIEATWAEANALCLQGNIIAELITENSLDCGISLNRRMQFGLMRGIFIKTNFMEIAVLL